MIVPFTEVDAIIHELLAGLQAVVGGELVGMYLYGSAVTGDFDPALSDIDLMVALTTDPDDTMLARLKTLHDAIADAHPAWRDRVEAQYLSLHALQTFLTQSHPLITISPGEPIHRITAGRDYMVNWYIVRRYGRTVYGPPPDTIIAPMTQAEFVADIRHHARLWRERVEHADARRPALAYVILTLCRALYVSTLGEQPSKRQAALWARQQMPAWASIIDDALRWRDTWRIENDVHDEEARRATVQFVNAIADRIDAQTAADDTPAEPQ